MSVLSVYAENSSEAMIETADIDHIQALLAEEGVRFSRIESVRDLPPSADQQAILAAYADIIAENVALWGYQSADVVRLLPNTPDSASLRSKFLAEHTHAEDEARLFVEGSGCFYLHANGKVFRAVLTAGDYISVPAGMAHWFDMGPEPFFTAIRFFTNPEGWVARFTGDAIADRFPKYE